MSRQHQARRLAVLEATATVRLPPDLVARLARETGVSAAEIIDEAERLMATCAREGAVTWEQRLAIVARDRGIPASELRSELEVMGIPWR
jgi:hypothetical protein